MLALLGLLGAVSGCLVNIAGEGSISATSVGWSGVATRAIDGNNNGIWGGGSCYHSGNDGENTLTVALKGAMLGVKYPISQVKIHNRADTCCDQRLDGAIVYVDEEECGTVEFTEGTTVYSFDCGGIEGSSVSVYHNHQYLQVCELEIMVDEDSMPTVPEYTNAALDRPTAQSSRGWGGSASRAVDGDTNKYWSGRSCTHTAAMSGNWWTVELDNEEYVHSVIVHNRLDCCSNRIDGAQVWIETSGDYELCGTISYEAGVSVIPIECGMSGTGIKITNDNSYLTLCEVQVVALSEPPSETVDE